MRAGDGESTPPGAVAGAAPPTGGASAGSRAAPGGAAAPDAPAPSFDIVRVEPDGSTVIAGRGEPGSEVVLLDGDTPVARAEVDATGQFAILPTLGAGDHALALQTSRAERQPVKSAQSVAVSIAKQANTRPLVALLSPDKPAEVLSDGGAGVADAVAPGRSGAPGAGSTPAPPVTLAIQTVEARQAGQFLASGIARPGSRTRVYLNGSYVADVTAGQDGRWSVEIQKGMTPGRYLVRADQVEPSNGKVLSRVEVPFDYPVNVGPDAKPTRLAQANGAARLRDASVRAGSKGEAAPLQTGPTIAAPQVAGQPASQPAGAASGTPTAGLPAAGAPVAGTPSAAPPAGEKPSGRRLASVTPSPLPEEGAAAAIVPDLKTTTVVRGENLWRISRKLLGRGNRYTEIYASNSAQIRNPALIYPGQVFVLPTRPAN